MKVILLEDVVSVSKSRLYGSKGETVRIVADYGNVLIVENSSGIRYPVKKEKTTA